VPHELAHIPACRFAYVLSKTLKQRQSRPSRGNAPHTILPELAAIDSTGVILPIATRRSG